MIRLLLALLLLATPVHASMVIGSGAANYSDIIFWAGFEDAGGDNLETSNCNSGTDTSWTPVSGAVINSTTSIAGTYDLSCPTESDQYQPTVTSGDYFNSAKGAIVFAVKPVTQLSDNYYLRLNNAASTNRLMFTMRSTDEVRVTWYYNAASKGNQPGALHALIGCTGWGHLGGEYQVGCTLTSHLAP